MKILWILICVTLTIAFVDAQKNSNVQKPVVALEKRSGPPLWRRPPEERRKQSLFPRNNMKFVITESTTPKTEVTKPMVSTKRPLRRKLFVEDKIDKRTWSFPTPEPVVKPQQSTTAAPYPKRNYNRRYKAKFEDEIAEPSMIKTVVIKMTPENSTQNIPLNKGKFVKVVNKINVNTNKASTWQPKKLYKKPGTKASIESFKQKMVAGKTGKEVKEVTEKVFLSKPADHVIQNNEPLKISSNDKVSKNNVDINDYERGKINSTLAVNKPLTKNDEEIFLSKPVDHVIQNKDPLKISSIGKGSKNIVDVNDYERGIINSTLAVNEPMAKNDVEIFSSKPVDHVIQNNEPLKISLIDKVSEDNVNANDYESGNANSTLTVNVQLSKNTEGIFLKKQVVNVIQNNVSFNTSLPNLVPQEYSNGNDNKSREANVTNTTINEQLKDTDKKLFLSTHVDDEIKSKKSLDASPFSEIVGKEPSLDKISEKYAGESKEVDMTKIAISAQLNNRTVENDSLSKQVDNMMQNDKSFGTSLVNAIYEEYVHKISDTNVTETTINEKVNEIAQNVFLGTQISNDSQSIDLLKLNVPGNVSNLNLADESDSRVIPATLPKIIENQENEPTVVHNTTTEELFSHSVPLEDMNIEKFYNQRNPIIFKLGDNLTIDEKTTDLSKVDKSDILMEVIANDERDYKNYDLSVHLNNSEPITLPILHINENTLVSNSQKFEDIANNFYEVNPIIDLEYNNNFSIENNIKTAEINVAEEYENRNVEINSDRTNIETTRVNNVTNDLETLIKAIKSNTTSLESTVEIADSQYKFDLNVIEQYSNRPNTESVGNDKTIIESDTHDNLVESVVEITFDNLNTVSAEEKPDKSVFKKPVVIINKNIADQITDYDFSINNGSMMEITQNTKYDNTIFNGIPKVNTEENIDDINDNKSIVDNLYNLVEIIKDKSVVGYDTEVVIDKTQLVNIDTNIIEEQSDNPLDDAIQTLYVSDRSLTESPIKILFNCQESPSAESISVEPEFNESETINKSVINGVSKTDEMVSTTNTPTTKVSLNLEVENTHIKDTQLVNKDMNIVKEYSDKPLEVATPTFYLSDGSLTESPLKILFGSQEELTTKNVSVQPISSKNIHTVSDKSAVHDLSETDVILSIINDRTTEVSLNLNVGDENSYVLRSTEISNIGNSSENNEHSTIIITLPSLDEVLSDNLSVGHDHEVVISESKFLNSHKNIVDDDIDKPHAITVDLDQNLGTKKDYIDSGHETDDALKGILFNNRKPSSNSVLPDLFVNMTTDDTVADQLNSTNEISTKVEHSSGEISLEVQRINTNSQTGYSTDEKNDTKITDSRNLSNLNNNNDVSSFGHTTEVAIPTTQFLGLHVNITEANSDEPKAVTIDLGGTTQSSYLSSESVDHGPIGLLDLLSSNNEHLNRLLETISNESVTSQSSLNDKDIPANEKCSVSTDKDTSEKSVANSSKIPDDNSSKSYNLKGEGMLNELNIVSIKGSNESFINNSISSNEAISSKSSVAANDSSSTIEGMFEKMIDQADQFRKSPDIILDDSNVLNNSSVTTQEEISDKITAGQSKNLTDEIFNKLSVSSDISSNVKTTVDNISVDVTPDKSEKTTDEIPNESYILNDTSGHVISQEDIPDEVETDQLKNWTDEISKDSHILDDSSMLTQEEVSDETTKNESKNLTDDISNETYILNDSSNAILTDKKVLHETTTNESENITEQNSNELHILNESSSIAVGTEDIIDDLLDDKSEYFTDEISNDSLTIIAFHTSEEKSEELAEQSKNLTAYEPTIDIRHPKTDLACNDNVVSRITKRSNNVIEEENLAPNLSNFKYTEHVSRLGHNSSFKNINA